MPILHKNITAETDIHNPKWFSNANNGDYAWKNEQGNLESIDELLLPAALNFVDGSVAPPTSNVGDIYVLSSGGSVNAGWGSVSLQDWVRYDGAAWNSITPQKSSLCYNENTDKLLTFDGTAWAALGGDNVYTADGIIGSNRKLTITDNVTFIGSSNNNVFNIAYNGEMQFSAGGNMYGRMFTNGDWAFGGNTIIGAQAGITLHRNTLVKSEANTIGNTTFQIVDTSNSSFFQVRGNGDCIIGSNSFVASENISLQGETFIKGDDTLSTSTALAIYDGDTTPNKLWDFRNNGDIVQGTNAEINLNNNTLEFSNINSIGALSFSGTSNNGIGLNLANGSNDFDFVVAGSSNTLISTGSLGLLVGGAWAMQVKQNREVSIGTNFEPVAGYDLSVDKAYFDTEITVKAPAGIMQFNGYRTNNINPTTATFPNDKDLGLHKNTATGKCFLGYNDSGTIKFIELSTSGVPNPSVQETASTASFTIDADSETMGVLTGMTQNVNVEAPTGTPVQGQKLMLRFKDDGTSRNFTWNIIWRAIGVTLPTATTANKTLYVGAVYNSTDSKWDVISVKEEA
jgi:hypothetical protein